MVHNDITWENATLSWNDLDKDWEHAFLELAGGDDLQTAINDLEPVKKKKFIKLVCRMNNIKIYEESRANIVAKLDIKSVKFALKEISKPTLEIKNAI